MNWSKSFNGFFQMQKFDDFGFGFRSENYFAFFGNKKADVNRLQKEFSFLSFRRVRQTHSDRVIESITDSMVTPFAELPEADAHLTAEKNQALLILTADCLPVMVYCQQTRRVAAVHAGWRGVENRLIQKTLQHLIASGSDQRDFVIWIGPHIQQESFETQADTFQLLSQAHTGLTEKDYVQCKGDRYYIDLNRIIESQIRQIVSEKNFQTPRLWFSSDDTKTDLNYFSYRREPGISLRNLSFIARL